MIMKNEILDEIEREIILPSFALKSYEQFWKSIIIYIGVLTILFLLVSLEINIPNTLALLISLIVGMIGFIFNFFGILNFQKSVQNKEYFTWKLLVGGFGNLLFFLSWIWMLFIRDNYVSGCF